MTKTRILRAALLLAIATAASTAAAQERRGPFNAPPRSVRSRDIDQHHIRLEVAVNFDAQELRGKAVLTLAPLRPLRTVELDAMKMKIDRVVLVDKQDAARSRELKYETKPEGLSIALEREYKIDEPLTLAIDYLVTKPTEGAHFVVADASEPGRRQMMWTQGEPEFARYWFPCVDTPADRVTSETVVTAPKDCFVLSNGTLESNLENADGTRTWRWVQADSHVTYLVSVVVGEFEAMEQKWENLPIVSYVPKGRLADAARSFEKTPAMMAYFSEKIGQKYPWPKYAQICVEEYGWGGMEHTSATTLNVNTLHDERAHLDVSSDNLVAHELVHQWWGDLLTCKDWGELWLNESFATYFATLWTEQDLGPDEAAWDRRDEANSYLTEDRERYRRPIVSYRYDTPHHMFDRHSYPKGGRVLHMLRFVLGDELFWKSIRHYAAKNRFRTVEAADLRIAIDEATGQGLNWFFDQWLYKGGHPEFNVSWSWDDDSRSVRLSVRQTQKVDEMTPLFRMPVEIELATASGVATRKITVSKADEQFHFTLDSRPTRVCFDPRDWILKRITFDKSKEELRDQLTYDQHMPCRLEAVQGLARFAPDQDVRDVLARAAKVDNFWGVRQEAAKALGKFTGDVVRDTLLELAQRDPKAQVRRAAVETLAGFPHAAVSAAMRTVIAQDRSYYAVAAALRTLAKVDRDNCRDDLLAAVDQSSHEEVILAAACDVLVELKEPRAADKLRPMLDQPQSGLRRAILTSGLARMKSDDPALLELVKKQLENPRQSVRRAAISALADIGDPSAVGLLLARREKETRQGMLEAIDDGVAKLRGKERVADQLRKDLETLRNQNRALEERLKKLEESLKK